MSRDEVALQRRSLHVLPHIRVSFDPQRDADHVAYISSSTDVYALCQEIWNFDTINLFEEFKVFFLDRRNGVIGYRDLSRGDTTGTVVNIKLIFAIAVGCNASSFILVHNHPSGNLRPSQRDIDMTTRVQRGAEYMELRLLDHLIVMDSGYFSFMDEGVL